MACVTCGNDFGDCECVPETVGELYRALHIVRRGVDDGAQWALPAIRNLRERVAEAIPTVGKSLIAELDQMERQLCK